MYTLESYSQSEAIDWQPKLLHRYLDKTNFLWVRATQWCSVQHCASQQEGPRFDPLGGYTPGCLTSIVTSLTN